MRQAVAFALSAFCLATHAEPVTIDYRGLRLNAELLEPAGARPPLVPRCGPVKVRAKSFLNYHDADPRLDTPSLLLQIVLPTLVIAGSVDTNVPDVAPRTRPYVDADTRLVVIAGADHFFLDFLGEDAADAIAKFLHGQY